MDVHALPPLSLSSFVQDALVVVGAGVALLAGLAFITLGVLLPGLLTALGGQYGDAGTRYVEFGPAAGPLISDPAPPRTTPAEADAIPRPVAHPYLWSSSVDVRTLL